MQKMRFLAGFVLALLIPAGALAAVNVDSQNVTLAQGDNRTGTYFAFGQIVTVSGDVDGDVVCGAQNVVINGKVAGDVLCAGQSVTVNGAVTGSVRAGGQLVTVNGTVGRNVTVGAQRFVLGPEAKVGGEVAVGAQEVTLNAPVAGAAYIGAQTAQLNSTIGGNVTAYVDSLNLGKDAKVEGNLDYTSDATFVLDKDRISGQIARHSPATPMHHEPTAADRFEILLYWVAAALTGALLAVWLAPGLVRGVTTTMIKRWQASLGWGALVILGGPLVLVVLAITGVGLPAAAVLGILWLMAIFSSGIFAGVAVGRLAWQREDTSSRALALAALAGVPLVIIAHWLPWIGVLAGLAAGLWAVGGMVVAATEARKA